MTYNSDCVSNEERNLPSEERIVTEESTRETDDIEEKKRSGDDVNEHSVKGDDILEEASKVLFKNIAITYDTLKKRVKSKDDKKL
eukprot:2903927-Ditylum_brightwellii.AAC.1